MKIFCDDSVARKKYMHLFKKRIQKFAQNETCSKSYLKKKDIISKKLCIIFKTLSHAKVAIGRHCIIFCAKKFLIVYVYCAFE